MKSTTSAAPAKKGGAKPVAKKVAVKKAAAPAKKGGAFAMVLRYDDKVIEVETDNMVEVLSNQERKYIKTQLKLAVTHEGKTVERVIGRALALRIFRNKIAAMSLEKSLRLALNATE